MTDSYYPPSAFRFEVRLSPWTSSGEAADAVFQEVSGLAKEEQDDGTGFVHRLAGPGRHANLIFKKGLGKASSPLLAWVRQGCESALGTSVATHTLLVHLLDSSGAIILGWLIEDAWPVKWEIGPFTATTDEIAVEALEFAYSSCTLEKRRS